MTTPSAPTGPTSREILTEAREMLAATYWITGAEINSLWFSSEEDFQAQVDRGNVPDKHLKYTTDEESVIVATAMCSIGAMALARHMHLHTPLEDFGDIESRDWQSFRAAIALATAAVASGQTEDLGLSRSPADIIARWNDAKDMTDQGRQEILAGFDAAIASPLVTADTLWVLRIENYRLGIAWPTKQEGEAALAAVRRVYDRDQGEPFDHPDFQPWMAALDFAGYWDQVPVLVLVSVTTPAEHFR